MFARLVCPVPLDAVENLLLLLQVVVAGQGDVPAQLGLNDWVAPALQHSQAGADWEKHGGKLEFVSDGSGFLSLCGSGIKWNSLTF